MSRSLLAALVVVLAACSVTFAAASFDADASSLEFGTPSLQAESWPATVPVASADLFFEEARAFDLLAVTGTEESSSSSSSSSSTGEHEHARSSSSSSSSSTGVVVVASSSTGVVAPSSSSSSTGAHAHSNGTDSSNGTASFSPSSSSTGGAAALVTFQDAHVNFTALYNSTNIPQPAETSAMHAATMLFMRTLASTDATAFDRQMAKDVGSATGFPFENVFVSHTFANCHADGACAGPTLIAIRFHPTSTGDATASAASQLLSDQINCPATDASCNPPNGIRNQVIGKTLVDGVSPFVVGSATVNNGEVTVITPPGPDLFPASTGHANADNAGYYVLGAILCVFVIAAIVFFILHKAPVEEEDMPQKKSVELVETAAAHTGADEVVADEVKPEFDIDAAAGEPSDEIDVDDAAQMDYKSVFALRNNVLDHKEGDAHAAVADAADENDVHFVLHQ